MFTTLIESVVWSGALVALITVCGLGVANVVGLRSAAGRILLAPSLFVVAITLVIGPLVELRLPVRMVSPYIWVGCTLLAVYGLRGLRDALKSSAVQRILILAFIVSLLVLGGFQWYGLFNHLGSPNQDGLTYVSFSEYLRLYSRGMTGGLAPLYQFGSHLAESRFIESAMLALFIPPWADHAVDTQMVVGPLLLIGVFAFACSVAYVAEVVNERGLRNSRELSMLLAVFGGWLPFVLLANNFSNLCMLGFSPALFGMAFDRRSSGYARYLGPAVFSAASIYMFPELSPLVIAVFCIAGMENIFTGERNSQIKIWFGVAALTVALTSIFLPHAVHHFLLQLTAAEPHAGGRPGNGFMPDLLITSRLLASLWGFERIPFLGMSSETVSMYVGALLALVTGYGLIAAVRARSYSLCLYFVIIVVLAIVMITIERYDYGAYKILLLGWWATAVLLSAGATYIWSMFAAPKAWLNISSRVLLAATLLLSALLWGNQQLTWLESFVYKEAQPLREARDYLAKLNQTTTVTISDPVLSDWMVYELRNLPIRYSEYIGYMGQTHVLPVMARSDAPKQSGNYMLVGKGTMAAGITVWSNELFNVFKIEAGNPLVSLGEIRAPNRVERFDGSTFFWLGHDPATVDLHSSADEVILMDIELIGGPSVGDPAKSFMIQIELDGVEVDRFSLYSSSAHDIRLSLHAGTNSVVIKPVYDGAVKSNANGDPRILFAGVKLRKLEIAK